MFRTKKFVLSKSSLASKLNQKKFSENLTQKKTNLVPRSSLTYHVSKSPKGFRLLNNFLQNSKKSLALFKALELD